MKGSLFYVHLEAAYTNKADCYILRIRSTAPHAASQYVVVLPDEMRHVIYIFPADGDFEFTGKGVIYQTCQV